MTRSITFQDRWQISKKSGGRRTPGFGDKAENSVSNNLENGGKDENRKKERLVYAEDVDTEDADPLGNEPVYYNDKIVGVVTSGGYGFRVNKSLAFAYVESSLADTVEEFFIQIQGNMKKAKKLNQMAYDPKNSRLTG